MVLKHWSLSPDYFFQLESSLQVAAPLFCCLLHLSSLSCAYKIHRDQSSGILSGAPFVSLFVTSLVWSLYGFMLPDMTLAWPSVFGVVSGFVSCVSFHVYVTPESANVLYAFLYPAALVAVSVAIILANLGHVQWLGIGGSVIAVCSLTTSISMFQTVIRDKSTASLSYFTSMVTWFNSLSWATYGLIIRGDYNIFIPNILGFVVATLQLHLFVVYGYSFNSAGSFCFPCGEEVKLKGKLKDFRKTNNSIS